MIADRRDLLRLAAVTALLPVLSAAPARALASVRFAPPGGPMRYARTLRREMADGTAMIVSRGFAIRFVPEGRGFPVEGEQVEVSVDAPPRLARFAELERQRRELGLFPLTLDGQGLIYGNRAAIDTSRLDVAVREALAVLNKPGLAQSERDEAARFVSALQQGATRLVTELKTCSRRPARKDPRPAKSRCPADTPAR
jgi:hypothetical protein